MGQQGSKNKSHWMDIFLVYPGMDQSVLLKKSIVFSAQIYAAILTLAAWALYIPTLITFGIITITISLTTSIIYTLSIRKNMDWLVLTGMAVNTTLSLYFVIILGGIAQSGGLIMAGLILVILSTSLNEKRWTILLSILYGLTVVIALLLGTQNASVSLPSEANTLFFGLNFMFAGGLISFLIIGTYNLQARLMDAENTKSDRVSELNKIKSSIYSKLSSFFHDPLKEIVSLSKHSIGVHDTEITQKKMNKISGKAGQMIHFSNQMNDLARLEAGNLRVSNVQGDIIKFSRIIFESFKQFGNSRGIKVILDSNTQQFNLDFDPEITIKVLSNLMVDAIGRTPNGGTVNLLIRKVQENNFKDSIAFIISDQGRVVPREFISFLTKPFHTEDLASYSDKAGELVHAHTGALVKLLGGTIKAKSHLSKGTKTEVILPAQNASPFKEPISLVNKFEIIPGYLLAEIDDIKRTPKVQEKKINITIQKNLSPEHLN